MPTQAHDHLSTTTALSATATTSTTELRCTTCCTNAVLPCSSNCNIFWVAATAVCLWFLFAHAPVVLRQRGDIEPLLWFHLIGSYTVYLGCVHNALLTPSVIGSVWHVGVGRVAMVSGVVGFITGFIYAWWRVAATDLAFCIGVSIGGVGQMLAQTNGYMSIKRYQRLRDKVTIMSRTNDDDDCYSSNGEEKLRLEDEMYEALEQHVGNMITLFVQACGIPALIRLAQDTNQFALAMPIFVGAAFFVSTLYVRMFYGKIRTKRLLDQQKRQNVASGGLRGGYGATD